MFNSNIMGTDTAKSSFEVFEWRNGKECGTRPYKMIKLISLFYFSSDEFRQPVIF